MVYAVECSFLSDPNFSRLKRELGMAVFGRKCEQAETAVWHHQASSNSSQLQTAILNRRATGIPSSEHLHYNRRVVLMETSKTCYDIPPCLKAHNSQKVISVFYNPATCKATLASK